MACAYKNLFGKLGEGIHSYRIGNVAVLDFVVTALVAFFIQHFFFPKYNFFVVLFAFFLLGIFMHRLFCARTTIDKFLFPNA
jgi:hypothetical protein